jgi:predicted transcriptional regulator
LNDVVPSSDLLSLTADIVTAHVGHNSVATDELPILIASVHKALAAVRAPAEAASPPQEPAVSIRSSVKPDYLVSLESGKKMKMLKRYLMTNYGMMPDDYRKKWGLPGDYPMVAPDYAQQRKDLAVKIGLGRPRSTTPAAEPAPPAPEASAPRAALKGKGKGTLKIKTPKSEPTRIPPIEAA